MAQSREAVVSSLLASFAAGERRETPYRHWFVATCLPEQSINDINELPFPAPSLGGMSGKREVHNATRKYFDAENRAKYPVVTAVAEAFQSPSVTRQIEDTTGYFVRF